MLKSLHKLRGYAALGVLISHLPRWNMVPYGSRWDVLLTQIGWEGVAVFFIISGFIIAWSHRKDIGRRERLPAYAFKRAIRIYPAYWLYSAFFVLIGAMGNRCWDPSNVLHRSPVQTFLAASLLPISGETRGFIIVSWSLFFEMFFYLIFATFFLSRKLGIGAVCLLCVLSAIHHPFWNIPPFFFNRINLFFIFGVLLGFRPEWVRKFGDFSWLIFALAALSYAVLAVWDLTFNSIMTFAFAAFLVTATVSVDMKNSGKPPGVPSIWEKNWLWLGTISYSLYLCHIPVEAAMLPLTGDPRSFITVALFIAVPIAVASASYLLVEYPLQNFARRRLHAPAKKVPGVEYVVAHAP